MKAMPQLSRKVSLLAKRAIDVVASGAGLVVLAPILGASALAIRATMGSPIFFTHIRPGLGEKPFALRKFRTMRPTKPGEVYFRTDAVRITALGRFLRKASIDELPELWNVFTGEMSLVGPRPLLMEYLPKYSTPQRRRHDVRPGITGWRRSTADRRFHSAKGWSSTYGTSRIGAWVWT